jgi:hypothetical protein
MARCGDVRVFLNSKRGLTLMETMIGLAIIVAASLLLAGTISFFRSKEVRTDRRLLVQNVLTNSGMSFMSWPYDEIIAYCDSKNVFTGVGVDTSKCLDSTRLAFNRTSETAPPTNGAIPPTDILLNLELAVPDSNGNVCVALNKCTQITSQVVELELVAFWNDPDSRKGLNQSSQVIVRTKW